jgi:hypothetical protein
MPGGVAGAQPIMAAPYADCAGFYFMNTVVDLLNRRARPTKLVFALDGVQSFDCLLTMT